MNRSSCYGYSQTSCSGTGSSGRCWPQGAEPQSRRLWETTAGRRRRRWWTDGRCRAGTERSERGARWIGPVVSADQDNHTWMTSVTNLGFVFQNVDAAQRQEEVDLTLLRGLFHGVFIRSLDERGDGVVVTALPKVTVVTDSWVYTDYSRIAAVGGKKSMSTGGRMSALSRKSTGEHIFCSCQAALILKTKMTNN